MKGVPVRRARETFRISSRGAPHLCGASRRMAASPAVHPSFVLRQPQDAVLRTAPQDEVAKMFHSLSGWFRKLNLILRQPHFNVAKYATRSSRSFSAMPWNTPMAVPGIMVEGNIIQPPTASSVHSQLARFLNALV